jgi:hypothetical protein
MFGIYNNHITERWQRLVMMSPLPAVHGGRTIQRKEKLEKDCEGYCTSVETGCQIGAPARAE